MIVAGEPIQAQDGTSFTLTLDVAAKLIGKLIGKEGATIKDLQGRTGTRIQIDHKTPGDYKKVHVTGSRESLDIAKAQIQAALEAEVPAGQGDVTRTTTCPPGIVGRIIGRNGETIKSLQSASGAHIMVDQSMPEGQDRIINVTGKADSVDRAMKMVEELIKGEPGSATAIIQKVRAARAAQGMTAVAVSLLPCVVRQPACVPASPGFACVPASQQQGPVAGLVAGVSLHKCTAGSLCLTRCPRTDMHIAPVPCAVWRGRQPADDLPQGHGGPPDWQGWRDHQGPAEPVPRQHPDRPERGPLHCDHHRPAPQRAAC